MIQFTKKNRTIFGEAFHRNISCKATTSCKMFEAKCFYKQVMLQSSSAHKNTNSVQHHYGWKGDKTTDLDTKELLSKKICANIHQ